MRHLTLTPIERHIAIYTATLTLSFQIACQTPEPRTLQERIYYEEGYSYGSLAREAELNGVKDPATTAGAFIDSLNGPTDDRRPLNRHTYYFKRGYQDAYEGKPAKTRGHPPSKEEK